MSRIKNHIQISATIRSTYFILLISIYGCNVNEKAVFLKTKICSFAKDIGYLYVLDLKNKIISGDSGVYTFELIDSLIVPLKYQSPIDPWTKNVQLTSNSFVRTGYRELQVYFTKNGKLDTSFFLPGVIQFHNDSTYFVRHNQFNVLCIDSNTIVVYLERTDENLKMDGDLLTMYQYAKKFDKLGVFKISRAGYETKELFSPLKSMTFLDQNEKYMTIHSRLEQTKKDILLTYNFVDSIYFIDKKTRNVNVITLPKDVNFTYSDFSSLHRTYNQFTSRYSEAADNKIFETFVTQDENYFVVITLDGIKGSIPDELPNFNNHNWYLSIYDLKKEKWLKSHYFDGNEYNFRDLIIDNQYIAVSSKVNKGSFFVIFK